MLCHNPKEFTEFIKCVLHYAGQCWFGQSPHGPPAFKWFKAGSKVPVSVGFEFKLIKKNQLADSIRSCLCFV